MNRSLVLAAAVFAAAAGSAHAHGIAGDRVFPATLTIDDPAVGDELSLPTISTVHNGAAADGSAPGNREFDFGGEWDKTITGQLGVAVNFDYTSLQQDGGGSLDGWQNVVLTLKYQAYVNPEHEFMTSVGVIRELGGSGSAAVGADGIGSTTPTFYFGKGLGDLPIGLLRPLAITGELGYQVSDNANASPNLWNVGWSVQYSLPYLQQHVRDIGLPEVIAALTPLVEVNLTIPASGAGGSTTGTIAPGILYDADTWQVGIEALIPATRATNTGVGVIAQLHFFLDDLFPTTLGKPLF